MSCLEGLPLSDHRPAWSASCNDGAIHVLASIERTESSAAGTRRRIATFIDRQRNEVDSRGKGDS